MAKIRRVRAIGKNPLWETESSALINSTEVGKSGGVELDNSDVEQGNFACKTLLGWNGLAYFFAHKHTVDGANAKGVKHQREMEKPIFVFWSKDQIFLQNTWRWNGLAHFFGAQAPPGESQRRKV